MTYIDSPCAAGACPRLFCKVSVPLLFSAFLTSMPAGAQVAPVCPAFPSHIAMQRGTFSSQPDVTFELRHFVAKLVPQGDKAPLCYQKLTVVSHADIFVSNDSLTHVFGEKLSQSNSKIKGLQIENGLDKVSLRGEIVKVIPLKFSIEGPVTTDGKALILTATKIDADGIPIKALLGLIGDQLSSVLNFHGVNGVVVTGNTIAFYPEKIAHLKGHISGVDSSLQGITLHYGRAVKTAALHHANPAQSASSTSGDGQR